MSKLNKKWKLEYDVLVLEGKDDHQAVVEHNTLWASKPEPKWYWTIEVDNSRAVLDDKAPDMLSALRTAQDALDFVERQYKRDGNHDNVTLRNFKRLLRARKIDAGIITPKDIKKGKK